MVTQGWSKVVAHAVDLVEPWERLTQTTEGLNGRATANV